MARSNNGGKAEIIDATRISQLLFGQVWRSVKSKTSNHR